MKSEDIQNLINKVMPQLQSFVAGGRGSADKKVNYQIAVLRDALKDYKGADKYSILSQSVHGNNLTGGLFSFVEKNFGLGLSTTLLQALGRYNETVLEKRPASDFKSDFKIVHFADDVGKPLTLSSTKDALPKVDRKATMELLSQAEEFSQENPMLSKTARTTSRRKSGPLTKTEAAKMKMMDAYNKGDVVHIRPDTMDYFPRPKEEFSQENPMLSKAARTTSRRKSGPLTKTEAAKMKMMDAYNKGDVVHIRPDHTDTMDYFPKPKEEFSQKNPMYSKGARDAVVRRSEGPKTARDAERMERIEDYLTGNASHILSKGSKAGKISTGKAERALPARDEADKETIVNDVAPKTTKMSQEDAARIIQSGFRKRNKVLISALKMNKRVKDRTGPAAEELKAMVDRTIVKERGDKRPDTPAAAKLRLKKTGIDLT